MDKNASKEKSIDEISKKYKISSNDIYYFGDDFIITFTLKIYPAHFQGL